MSWSNLKSKSPAQICLQCAMWTLASLLSVQFRDTTEALHRKTKQMLENLSAEAEGLSDDDNHLAQAWILVVICESMRTFHRQAWMSVGRVFRFVQGKHFHQIDSPGTGQVPLYEGDSFIDKEEKRRIFWMAYFLDQLFSMRNDWPITLNEHMVRHQCYPRCGRCWLWTAT
jgi:hypothetical protein